MPAPSQAAITLAVVQARIAKREDLSDQARSELRSAINRFARICSRTPGEIIADPAVIRGLAKTAVWQIAGISKSSWAKILSRLRKSLQLVDVQIHRQRRNFRLDAVWQALLAPMSRRDHDELHRFAGWCSSLGIRPLEVTQVTFKRFLAYLDEQMIQRDPRERAHVARRAWNRTVAAQPGSPYPVIPAPEPVGESAIRWRDLPSSLQQEVEVYRQKMLAADPFDPNHKPIRPVTLDGYLMRLRIYITVLVRDGVPPERFSSLQVLVEKQTVKRGWNSG
jgi:hypothetical protein